jgi:hypothetical protein
MYMRIAICIGVLCLFLAAPLRAQIDDAGDPKAINITPLLQIIDTSHLGFGLNANLNIGDIDGDGFEDMGFGCHNDTINDYTVIHFGGNKMFSPSSDSIIFGLPYACADFDGNDGKQDLITLVDGHPLFRKNYGTYPYFSSIRNGDSSFYMYTGAPKPVYVNIDGIIDYDEDGKPDVIGSAGNIIVDSQYRDYLITYRGGNFKYNAKSGIRYVAPNDSCLRTIDAYCIVGKFGNHLKPMTICSNFKKVGVKKNELPFSEDTIVWISDSNVIDSKAMFAMDITGDGVTDLLITDGMNIYVYKGDDNFGNYKLTKENAYYIIKSPAQLDLNYTLMKDFGGYFHDCGNLIGDDTPLLMVTGTVHNDFGDYATYAFFYSGGKALDSYYDAWYREYRQTHFTLDTLHSIDNSGRGAVVFQSSDGPSGENFLLYNGCWNIPRTPNPDLRIVRNQIIFEPSLQIIPTVAHHYITLKFGTTECSGELRIINVLGQEVERRNISSDQSEEFLSTSSYPTGVFVAEFQSNGVTRKTKFVVEH